MGDDQYPHWRTALFGQDAIANLRCAVDYVFWHSMYAVLAVLGVLVIGSITAIKRVGTAIAGTRVEDFFNWLTAGVIAFVNSDRVSTVLYYSMWAPVVLAVVLTTYLTIIAALQDPWQFVIAALQILGLSVGTLVLFIVGIVLIDRYQDTASNAASKTKETPVLRRVYGECPVDLDIEPKWFDTLFDSMADDE